MSFVSVLVNEDFISIMSDGRMTGENNAVLREDYKKFYEVAGGKFVAFSGSAEQSAEIADQIRNRLEDGVAFSEINRVLTDLYHSPSFKALGERGCRVFLFFGGINPNGKIEFYESVSIRNEIIVNHYLPVGRDFNIRFAAGYVENPEYDLNRKLDEIFTSVNLQVTPENCFEIQKSINDYVAEYDECVNTKTYNLIIKK